MASSPFDETMTPKLSLGALRKLAFDCRTFPEPENWVGTVSGIAVQLRLRARSKSPRRSGGISDAKLSLPWRRSSQLSPSMKARTSFIESCSSESAVSWSMNGPFGSGLGSTSGLPSMERASAKATVETRAT